MSSSKAKIGKEKASAPGRGVAADSAPATTAAGGDAFGRYVALCECSRLFTLIILVLFAVFVHSRVRPLVSDVDSFYHLRHSWVYQTSGLFDSSFPWAQLSVVKTYAADLWYGFHILTIPLTFLSSLLDAIYWASFLITVTSLSLIALAFRRLNIRWPLFWVFFVALLHPDVLYRLTMARPHPLSLGLNLLLFSFLVTERSRYSEVVIFAIAAALSWMHLALSWLPVLVAGVVCGVRLLHRQGLPWRTLAVFFPGLLLGIFLRPNPIGGLHLAYIQVIKLMVEKQTTRGLGFGIELLPFYWINFADMFIPITILLLLGGACLVFLKRSGGLAAVSGEAQVATWSSLVIALIFFVLTFTVARRSHEVFFGVAAIFLALVFRHWRAAAQRSWHASLGIPVALLILWIPFSISRFDAIIANAFHPMKFKEAAEWLAGNAKAGEIVYHVHWDRFGELFFWNPRNYYINGMDPIFAYTYDPGLTWKGRYYELDVADEVTCPSLTCSDDEAVTTYDFLKREVGASYAVVERDRNPKLSGYLDVTPQFAKVFESTTRVVVYRIY